VTRITLFRGCLIIILGASSVALLLSCDRVKHGRKPDDLAALIAIMDLTWAESSGHYETIDKAVYYLNDNEREYVETARGDGYTFYLFLRPQGYVIEAKPSNQSKPRRTFISDQTQQIWWGPLNFSINDNERYWIERTQGYMHP
jgi:hypothetical protein